MGAANEGSDGGIPQLPTRKECGLLAGQCSMMLFRAQSMEVPTFAAEAHAPWSTANQRLACGQGTVTEQDVKELMWLRAMKWRGRCKHLSSPSSEDRSCLRR